MIKNEFLNPPPEYFNDQYHKNFKTKFGKKTFKIDSKICKSSIKQKQSKNLELRTVLILFHKNKVSFFFSK
jgi:hypothetical protein